MTCPTHPCNCCTGACCCGRNTCTSLNCADCTTTAVTSTKGYGDFMGYGVLCSDHLVGSGSAATYYPYCDKPIGWCCNKATGACARDSINGPTISQCECYREKGAPPTIEFAGEPLCADPTLPCCPFGVCCYTSGVCGEDTKCMCEYLGGNFISEGEENVCLSGACCQGTTCAVRTKCACSQLGGSFQGYSSVCSPNPCTAPPYTPCTVAADCPGFLDEGASCCNGGCVGLGCCIVTFTSSCLATCNMGCQPVTSGPNAGQFQCYTDICAGNPLP